MKKIFGTLIALIMCIMFIPNVSADQAIANAQKPTKSTNGNIVFANGIPITIKEKNGNTVVTWDGATEDIEVDQNTTIFGGGHNDDNSADYETTKITMESGTVRNIFGGGLHKSHVKSATINFNGGEVTGSIVGGGAGVLGGYSDSCTLYNGNNGKDGATTIVDETIINLNGGKAATVFGGGEAISYTKNARINVSNGDYTYIIAGGSNGYTDSTEVNVINGTIGTIQSVNRGTVESSDVNVYGGTINNLYVGGEDASDVTGTIKNSKVNVEGGTVENLKPGKSDNSEISSASVNTTVSYRKESVKNADSLNESVFGTIIEIVKFKIDNIEYTAPVGTKLKDIEGIDDIKTKEGYQFKNFALKSTNEVYSEDSVIEDGTELVTVFEKINATPKTPQTFDGIVGIGIVGLVSVIGIALCVTCLRKRSN